ncbi:MAG TPA: DUF4919 domain-containing protein [Bacteroidetes bacterium]|nr:DUF4919 domain-containing protein [Bacteroidota bacterium]
MKKSLFTFFTFFIFQNINAQAVPHSAVETVRHQLGADSTLLPRLATRFAEGDTTLTLAQLSVLYYGYGLSRDADPAGESRILDAASILGRREKYDDAIALLDRFLKKNPGSLAALLERAYTSWLVNDSTGTVNGYKKYYQLMEVPLRSGTGQTPQDAIVVSSLRDMELIVDKLGFYITSQLLLRKNGHAIYKVICATEENPKMKKVFYFNVDLPLLQRG